MPVTTPVLVIVATDGVPLLQEPPVVDSVKVVVVPVQRVVGPPIAATDGNEFTENTTVATAVPQVPETV